MPDILNTALRDQPLIAGLLGLLVLLITIVGFLGVFRFFGKLFVVAVCEIKHECTGVRKAVCDIWRELRTWNVDDRRSHTIQSMRVASGRVIDGRVELTDTELPEGAAVTVLLREGDETFEADEETERMLLESIAQCERGETVPFETVLEELRRRE